MCYPDKRERTRLPAHQKTSGENALTTKALKQVPPDLLQQWRLSGDDCYRTNKLLIDLCQLIFRVGSNATLNPHIRFFEASM
jgi:hypothetical protein